ncbi:hypothetical protein TWF173_000006 [Orbilia oligospora]|nr:hypothetical protein TWF173_000006 [Orbilia oligospora]
MSSKLLPLSHSAQHQLEQRKAEIVKVQGQRDCPAEVRNAEKSLATQTLELQCQVIDSAIAQTINETENLHNLLTGVSNRLDAVFERYVTTEETVEDVTGRLEVVEYKYKKLDAPKNRSEGLRNGMEEFVAIKNRLKKAKADLMFSPRSTQNPFGASTPSGYETSQRLGVMEGKLEKLEVATKSDRIERLEVINHNAWAFNNQASDEASIHPSATDIDTGLILPLDRSVTVQQNLDICRRAFVRHIGLKWEVVEKFKLFDH